MEDVQAIDEWTSPISKHSAPRRHELFVPWHGSNKYRRKILLIPWRGSRGVLGRERFREEINSGFQCSSDWRSSSLALFFGIDVLLLLFVW
jgi:hypothetical protein